MAKVLDGNVVTWEFELQAGRYGPLRINTLREMVNPHIPRLGVKYYPFYSFSRMAFALVLFYGILTIEGYLMPDLFLYISSSCHIASTDFPNPLSPPISIVHCSREVFKATSCIGTELLHVGSTLSSYLCSSMWRSPQEYVTYEFVLTSPAVSCISGSFNFDKFRNGW